MANYSGNLFLNDLPADFDMHYALDLRYFWQFLKDTPKEELEKLQRNNPNDWECKLLERFDRLMRKHGVVHLLKKELSVDDAQFNLMYPAPLVSSSDAVKENFASNIFIVTRQLRYSKANPPKEIDMVLFLNGIPLITMDLKNHWIGQIAHYHG